MEIKNKEAFEKAFNIKIADNAILPECIRQLANGWNAAIESTEPKPESEKWEPKLGNWNIQAWGNVDNGTTSDKTRLFGMERETKEQAIKARDDYRIMHLLHTWLTEQGWGGDARLIATTKGYIGISFSETSMLCDSFFEKLKSGEIEL